MRTSNDKSTGREVRGVHSPTAGGLRRELAWLLIAKFAALLLLWWLFFSPAHRLHVDSEAASRRFALLEAPTPAATLERAPQQ